MRLLTQILLLTPHLLAQHPARGPVVITNANVNDVMQHSELVFVSFVAEWCHFSRLLTPVWEEASKELSRQYPQEKLTFGVVQTDKGGADLGIKYNVNKYPTMKIFRNGVVGKKEYRGARSTDAFAKYINDQLRSSVHIFNQNSDFENGNPTSNPPIPKIERNNKRNVVGYFENTDSASYKAFETLAGNLKDDCTFYAGVGEGTAEERISGENVVFKPEGENSSDQVFMGDITNYDLLNQWILEKCVPLVREITFTNGEELTEEGKPFMILFHKKEDTQSLDEYKKVCENEMKEQRSKLTILHADCDQFAHPLWHLGKTVNNCPLIAIDSFKHMYTFKDFKDIHKPGKLNQFAEDLHSGKLHREFHNGPDPESPQEIPQIADNSNNNNNDNSEDINKPAIDPKNIAVETKTKIEVVKQEPGQDPNKAPVKVVEEKVLVNKEDGKVIASTKQPNKDEAKAPPESQFAKLKPSGLKYSIPNKDEL